MDIKARDLPLKFIMAMGLAYVSAATAQGAPMPTAEEVALVEQRERLSLWGPHAQADASSTK